MEAAGSEDCSNQRNRYTCGRRLARKIPETSRGRRPQGEKIEEEDRVRACRCRFFGFLSSNCQASRRSERALCSGWESCQTRSGSRNGRVEAGGNYRQDRRETLTDTVTTDSGIPVK